VIGTAGSGLVVVGGGGGTSWLLVVGARGCALVLMAVGSGEGGSALMLAGVGGRRLVLAVGTRAGVSTVVGGRGPGRPHQPPNWPTAASGARRSARKAATWSALSWSAVGAAPAFAA
jgi:hypothetical protein